MNGTHDQDALNQHLHLLSYKLLPRDKYFTIGSVSEGKILSESNLLVKKNIIMHHANYIIGLKDKIDLMSDVKYKLPKYGVLYLIAKYKFKFKIMQTMN